MTVSRRIAAQLRLERTLEGLLGVKVHEDQEVSQVGHAFWESRADVSLIHDLCNVLDRVRDRIEWIRDPAT